jgi:hypothetical protein
MLADPEVQNRVRSLIPEPDPQPVLWIRIRVDPKFLADPDP